METMRHSQQGGNLTPTIAPKDFVSLIPLHSVYSASFAIWSLAMDYPIASGKSCTSPLYIATEVMRAGRHWGSPERRHRNVQRSLPLCGPGCRHRRRQCRFAQWIYDVMYNCQFNLTKEQL